MLNYFKNHLVAKIGFLFFVASLCIVVSSYYISIYWVNLQKDDILDAHDAYFQYKLVESWGHAPDTLLVSQELNNIHMGAMIYYLDNDHDCENDSLLFWSNLGPGVASCDYFSHLDTDMLGANHDILYDQWVSFGEISLNNAQFQTTYVEFPPLKYFLVSSYVDPGTFMNFIPPLFLVFILMGGLFFVVRKFLHPINLIEKRIIGLESGDLDSRIPVFGGDELAVLSKNFNTLIDDVKNLLKQKERLLADVSHELRTPLAKMRLSLAMLPKHKKIHSIDKQISSIDSLITNILLSDKMASAYSNLKLTEVSVESLVNQSLELTFSNSNDIKLDFIDSFVLSVDVVKTSIAIKNLIENAFKYSNNSSVLLRVFKKNDFKIISVIDSGPGIPESQLEQIKKAFVRLSNNKSGFGLGLSICNKVMLAHGGSLEIKNNSTGKGATFSLKFKN